MKYLDYGLIEADRHWNCAKKVILPPSVGRQQPIANRHFFVHDTDSKLDNKPHKSFRVRIPNRLNESKNIKWGFFNGGNNSPERKL